MPGGVTCLASSIFIVIAYVLVVAFVAFRARLVREFVQFSLAGRTLGVALIFGSLCATYVGPGFSIGFAGKGFHSGLLFWVIGLAYSAQNVLVGLWVAPRLRASQGCQTLGDVMGQKYDRKCHVIAGVISVGLCAGFSAVMAKAGGEVLQSVFSGLGRMEAVTVIVSFAALYTIFGGLRASVITDAFHFTVFSIFLPLALIIVLAFHVKGGTAVFSGEAISATKAGFGSTSGMEIFGLLTAFLLGETLIPPYANRALASRTTQASRNSFVLAGIFSIGWFMVMVSLGIAARLVVPKGTGEDRILLTLFKTVMPGGGYVLLLMVLVSVVMSSLDSLLNAGAVAFAQDVVKPFVKVEDSAALSIGRVATVAIAAVAAVGATQVPGIVTGLLMCYTVWAPAVLPALIIGLWIKKPYPLAGMLSMGAGTAAAIVFQFRSVLAEKLHVSFGFLQEVPAILAALILAVLAYVVGHWIAKLKGRL